jgi:hypothetical protein
MKQATAQKRIPLALVNSEPRTAVESSPIKSYLWERFTYSRLAEASAENGQKFHRPLRTEDVLQVQMATVREGYNHRRWPPDIIAKFMRADVIAR